MRWGGARQPLASPPILSLQPRIMLPRARGTARVELCVSCSTLPGGQSFEIGHHVFPIALDGRENIQAATQNVSFAPLPGVQAPTPLLDNFPASLPHPRLQGGWHSPAPSDWPQVMASRSVTPLYLGGSEGAARGALVSGMFSQSPQANRKTCPQQHNVSCATACPGALSSPGQLSGLPATPPFQNGWHSPAPSGWPQVVAIRSNTLS